MLKIIFPRNLDQKYFRKQKVETKYELKKKKKKKVGHKKKKKNWSQKKIIIVTKKIYGFSDFEIFSKIFKKI